MQVLSGEILPFFKTFPDGHKFADFMVGHRGKAKRFKNCY
jgi:hypothetical protein